MHGAEALHEQSGFEKKKRRDAKKLLA